MIPTGDVSERGEGQAPLGGFPGSLQFEPRLGGQSRVHILEIDLLDRAALNPEDGQVLERDVVQHPGVEDIRAATQAVAFVQHAQVDLPHTFRLEQRIARDRVLAILQQQHERLGHVQLRQARRPYGPARRRQQRPVFAPIPTSCQVSRPGEEILRELVGLIDGSQGNPAAGHACQVRGILDDFGVDPIHPDTAAQAKLGTARARKIGIQPRVDPLRTRQRRPDIGQHDIADFCVGEFVQFLEDPAQVRSRRQPRAILLAPDASQAKARRPAGDIRASPQLKQIHGRKLGRLSHPAVVALQGRPVVPGVENELVHRLQVTGHVAQRIRVGTQEIQVEGLSRQFDAGLIQPQRRARQASFLVQIAAPGGIQGTRVEAGWNRRARSVAIIIGRAMAIGDAKSPLLGRPLDHLPAMYLPSVGQVVQGRARRRPRALLRARSGERLQFDELVVRPEPRRVRSIDDRHVIDRARIELAKHRVQIDARRNPVRAGGGQRADGAAANPRLVDDRVALLHGDPQPRGRLADQTGRIRGCSQGSLLPHEKPQGRRQRPRRRHESHP